MFHKILKQVKQPTTLAPIFIPKLEQIKEKINERTQDTIKKPIKPIFKP